MSKITPCLWFDTQGEEAATLYTSVFPNSTITGVTRYGSAGPRPEGTVMTVSFELDGQPFVALNGGPEFTFNELIDDPDQEKAQRVMAAMLSMGKIEIDELERAARG
jgi:predicted 3-demethylubiquinone-9 3-methyltransferase (glyoxalase superfamily)